MKCKATKDFSISIFLYMANTLIFLILTAFCGFAMLQITRQQVTG